MSDEHTPTAESLRQTIAAMLERLDAEQLQRLYRHAKVIERT